MVDGENKLTSSMLLFFDEESLPSHIKLGFMRYPVRASVHKPLQCHKCTRFGNVSCVCRREEYQMPYEGKCCNCGGEHAPEFLECPVRVNENEVARVRSAQRVSYLEAVRRSEGTSGEEEAMVIEPPRPVRFLIGLW